MKVAAKSINPEDYILSVLSPEDRLDAAFKIAKEAFKNSKLTMTDIDNDLLAMHSLPFQLKILTTRKFIEYTWK